MTRSDRPGADRWDIYNGVPHSVPLQMPDRYEHPQTLIYGPKGEALLIRQPRHFGFRPIGKR